MSDLLDNDPNRPTKKLIASYHTMNTTHFTVDWALCTVKAAPGTGIATMAQVQHLLELLKVAEGLTFDAFGLKASHTVPGGFEFKMLASQAENLTKIVAIQNKYS